MPKSKDRDPLALFEPAVADWFRSSLGEPTRAQRLGWPAIARGESTLLLAPTGSGKTLAAFLAVLNELVSQGEPPPRDRCKVLYISPLKALAVDIERNLRAPLVGIGEAARRRNDSLRVPTAAVRTGDTPARDRARMVKLPPDILITTPETLYLMLTSEARHMLASVDTVIVDEIHAVLPTKRGAHLFLSLERLEALRGSTRKPLRRIGLSATQRPLEEVARLLGGFSSGDPRPVTVVDAREKKPLELQVTIPDDEFERVGELEELGSGNAAGLPPRKSVWPKIHEDLVARIRQHRTTMIFVNSRRLAERLATALNELAEEELALAHHGSVAREKRVEIEERLKMGRLPAIVATSSLELGIDIGSVDLVVQIEAPPSVAAGLQRIGRASHQVGGTPRGVILPKHRGDLAACAVVTALMREGLVEETFYPKNPLDVLAQQMVAITAVEPTTVDALYDLVRQAAPFAELPRSVFEGVLDMLSGRYPSDDFAELRPRLTWDRIGGELRARDHAKRLAITSGGTIPDRGLYGVFLSEGDHGRKDGRRVGELDEEMVHELREGEVFLLGASAWRAVDITQDRVFVTPATGEPGKMPFWRGDRPGRSRALGEALGALLRKVAGKKREDAVQLLQEAHDLDEDAASILVNYTHEQKEATAEVPSDRTIVIERFTDEIGDHRVCVLSPFGGRVHTPWLTAVLARLRQEYLGDVEGIASDDGMVFRIPGGDEAPPADLFLPAAEEVENLVTASLGDSALFASRFRENAARALLLPRRNPGRRTPLWAQRKRAADLLAVASQYPSFPMLLETYRECLRDVFDMPSLKDVLERVGQRRIRVHTVDTVAPSPFAASLMFSFVASFIYDGDAPLAERRLQALQFDHAQLRELLGEAELRQLLDPELLQEHERYLQGFAYPAASPDALHDLLRRVGDLSRAEIVPRCEASADVDLWLKGLLEARRVIAIRVAGEGRYVAAEDSARFRDALGVVLPKGLPGAFLEAVRDPLGDLVRRYCRTHGPFAAEALAKRLGLSEETAVAALEKWVQAGSVTKGAFLPGRDGTEYCDQEVLKTLRKKSLAELRQAVEPVEPEVFARFLPEWQGLTRPQRGPDGLLKVVAQLEGCPVPASALERYVLPARVEKYTKWDLDELCASGEVVWVGLESLGPHDGRIALYLADHEALLAPEPAVTPGPLPARIRAALEKRGALFFQEIVRLVGGFPQEILQALWDMVWAGEVANDTLEALRSWRAGEDAGRGRARRGGQARGTRRAIPGSEGRWLLRAARVTGLEGETKSPTERTTALVRVLLQRYGIVTREVALAENVRGGFSAIYPVLKAMEESGRLRRGYFIAGQGAAQFAEAGAEEQLRLHRARAGDAPSREAFAEGDAVDGAPSAWVLSSVDPANAYGALVPWPPRAVDAANEGEGERVGTVSRLQRHGAARVILQDGRLLGYLGRTQGSLVSFVPTDEPDRSRALEALAASLAGLVSDKGKRVLLLRSIDGAPPGDSPLAPYLRQVGFRLGAAGFLKEGRSEHA